MKRVIGIGNALTDMLVNLKTDKVLDTFNLPKGSMSLVDAALQTEISKSVAGLPYSLSLGGSAGNTIRAMARLGCDVGFIGKVGTDKTGDFFIQALENLGIEPFIFRGKERSGRCVSLISPDGERTMVTFLGAALELSAAEVTPAIFEGYDCLYIEGYLVQDHELIAGAVRTAKACGLKVAIDLASFNVVEANLEFLRSLIQDYVDIVFANEDEAKAFTGEGEPLNALQMLSELCELAVVKVGIKGALIKRGSEVVHVGSMAAAKRVDTTGAGVASGALLGETAEQTAIIVKSSQNVLLGIAAFVISLYWSYKGQKKRQRPSVRVIWERFPKFVVGFVAVSLLFSLFFAGNEAAPARTSAKMFSNTLFNIAFVCIGLETRFRDIFSKENRRTFWAFMTAQMFNIVVTLIVAYLLFGVLKPYLN